MREYFRQFRETELFYRDTVILHVYNRNENEFIGPCERFVCGLNAQCTPSDPPKCLCVSGYKGDPLQGCVDVNECLDNPCAKGAHCINGKGSYKCTCPVGASGDPYTSGCKYINVSQITLVIRRNIKKNRNSKFEI